MALWILNRPAELADPTELRVADFLTRLSNDWVIRWGFHYQDDANQTREGDFLVLGPMGGLMVIEVKSDIVRPCPPTGRWDSGDGDHPLIQLDAEWKAVVRLANEHRNGRPGLYVARALALPHVDIAPQFADYRGIPRELVLSIRELRDFPSAWAARMERPGIHLDGRSRAIFFETYGRDATPEALDHFVDESDRALLRLTEANYELLDQLAGNRQFVVRGGIGSGKTWLAIEMARRWAEAGTAGSRVLFLAYNLALTDFIRDLVKRIKHRRHLSRGEIVVRSWEELASALVTRSGLVYDVPADGPARVDFYARELPNLLMQIVREGLVEPEFDALVVDEAQDHDTSVAGWPTDWAGPGWWGVYWSLLHERERARVALFYDPSQRPQFRPAEAFDAGAVYAVLGANPVQLQLLRTVRYSRPMFEHLKSLRAPGTADMVEALVRHGTLPEGPPPETVVVSAQDALARTGEIIRRWIDQGYCRAEEILILSRHGRAEKSVLNGVHEVGRVPLTEYRQRRAGCIAWTSVNKAKGLDALAVVLIDFPPFEGIVEPGFQAAYFMGASRARQLFAAVHVQPSVT